MSGHVSGNVGKCREMSVPPLGGGPNMLFASGVVNRPAFPDQVKQLNNILYQWQFLHDYRFIFNENIRGDCLAYDNHHLNVKGSLRLSANFRRAINKPYI